MKHIMLSCQSKRMYQEIEGVLKSNYEISPFTFEIDIKDLITKNQLDLLLVAEQAIHPEILISYHHISSIPGIEDIPVIFLVRQGNEEFEQQLLDMGIDDYINLPISPVLLLHRVNTCLVLHALRKEKSFDEKYQDSISRSFAELVEFRDVTTGGHLKNTTKYFNVLLQEVMRQKRYQEIIPIENVKDVLRGVMLHDIGKIGINDEILRKEAALDVREFEYMKTHTTLGKQAFDNIIRETGGSRWLYLARDMAYCHHERWDGEGYPNGLKAEEIPLFARILAVADVYDALTSDRTYKKAFSHEEAVENILRDRGTRFDPDLVELFMNVKDQFELILNNKRNTEALEKE